jgi:hypothetical protein
MTASRSQKARKALTAKLIAGIGGFAAAALSIGLSLYQARTAGEVASVSPGASVDSGQWSVTLYSAKVSSEMPDGARVPDGSKAVIVEAALENLTAESSNLYRKTVRPDFAKVPEPQFYLTRDRSILWDLQPLMPEKIEIAWQVPASQQLPEKLSFAIGGTIYKAKDNLYAAPGWFPSSDVAKVELPLLTSEAPR